MMSQPPTMAGAWRWHEDPAGFSLRIPVGCRVHSGRHGEIVVSELRGTAAALLRTRSVPTNIDLAWWLEHDYAATEPGLHNVCMLSVERREPQLARAVFDYGSHVFQGRASVVAARDGNQATLFVAAAARNEFAQHLPVLRQILGSLRFDPSGPQRHRIAGEHFPLDHFLHL